MLARIRRLEKAVMVAITVVVGCMLAACATHKENVALVDDPDGKKDSTIPWNKQEKWENTGPLSGLTDRR
jgi:hypothetical protein